MWCSDAFFFFYFYTLTGYGAYLAKSKAVDLTSDPLIDIPFLYLVPYVLFFLFLFSTQHRIFVYTLFISQRDPQKNSSSGLPRSWYPRNSAFSTWGAALAHLAHLLRALLRPFFHFFPPYMPGRNECSLQGSDGGIPHTRVVSSGMLQPRDYALCVNLFNQQHKHPSPRPQHSQ